MVRHLSTNHSSSGAARCKEWFAGFKGQCLKSLDLAVFSILETSKSELLGVHRKSFAPGLETAVGCPGKLCHRKTRTSLCVSEHHHQCILCPYWEIRDKLPPPVEGSNRMPCREASGVPGGVKVKLKKTIVALPSVHLRSVLNISIIARWLHGRTWSERQTLRPIGLRKPWAWKIYIKGIDTPGIPVFPE